MRIKRGVNAVKKRRKILKLAKGYFGGLVPLLVEGILQETGVKHDIAVVGHKHVLLLRVEAVKTAVGETFGATGNDLLVDAAHNLQLEVAYGMVGTDLLTYSFKISLRIDVGRQQREGCTVGYTLHGCRYLALIEGADIVKLFVYHI